MATKRAVKKPERPSLNIAYIGNFGAPHSTENHVARALETNGHAVNRLQENADRLFPRLLSGEFGGPAKVDLILWTRTGWDYTRHGYTSNDEALKFQALMLSRARSWDIPVVGYHLDLFHGLNPEREAIVDEPFFHSDLVVTADGGSQEWFASKGVNHHWMPPGVSAPECEPGMFRDEFHSKLAFVGSWQGGYHQESQHRFELVRWLQQNFRRDCAFWPEEGRPSVRGADLRDLYASVDVVVGDSCLVGTGHANYWSDRIPETLGRGGLLIHPYVPGLEAQFDVTGGQHQRDLLIWEPFLWEELGEAIEWALAAPVERRELAAHGRATVLAKHTYEVRMGQLVELLYGEGLLK